MIVQNYNGNPGKIALSAKQNVDITVGRGFAIVTCVCHKTSISDMEKEGKEFCNIEF